MKSVLKQQKEKVESLLKLIKENPSLEILPMVDGEICEDNCGTWLGCWGEARIDEYHAKHPKIQAKRPIKNIKNMTLGLEIFNLFDNANKISYFWIEDVSSKYYAVPNYLTSRRLNLKLSIKL